MEHILQIFCLLIFFHLTQLPWSSFYIYTQRRLSFLIAAYFLALKCHNVHLTITLLMDILFFSQCFDIINYFAILYCRINFHNWNCLIKECMCFTFYGYCQIAICRHCANFQCHQACMRLLIPSWLCQQNVLLTFGVLSIW